MSGCCTLFSYYCYISHQSTNLERGARRNSCKRSNHELPPVSWREGGVPFPRSIRVIVIVPSGTKAYLPPHLGHPFERQSPGFRSVYMALKAARTADIAGVRAD